MSPAPVKNVPLFKSIGADVTLGVVAGGTVVIGGAVVVGGAVVTGGVPDKLA